MSAKANNVRIGLFVLVAVVLFILGLLAFGAKSYFQQKTKFETAIPGEVYGLSVGSRVELRGVPVGKVTRIAFGWNVYPQSRVTMIVVDFEVDENILPTQMGLSREQVIEEAVKRGLRAMVKNQGITGTSLLSLETLNPAEFPPPEIDYTPRRYYIPSAPAQFTRMLESIEKSLHNIQDLNFAGIGQGITNVLDGVRELTDKLNRIDLKAIGTNANALLVQIKELSANLQRTVDDMRLKDLGQNADELLAGLRDSNARLQTILDHAAAAPIEDTIADLRQTLRTLNGVLLELKQYPSGFFLGKPPLPAKSVEPPPK
jgi:ABC-type transporter Mla subunit MlaD